MKMIPISLIEQAAGEIDPVFLHTPVVSFPALDMALNCRMWLKVETVNPIRCFKGRGADFLLSQMTCAAGRQIYCASAGNFGQGIAYAARRRGLSVNVFASRAANTLKLDAIRTLGAHVVQTGADFDEAKLAAAAEAERVGGVFLNDGAHVANAAGTGTIAKEITDAGIVVDELLVPLGNGGLINGIGSWTKEKCSATKITGIAAAGAPSMEQSWRENKVVELASVDTIADGLAVRVPVPEALDMMRYTVDEVATVSDAAMIEAMRLLKSAAGLVVEPSGAIGVALVLEQQARFPGCSVATILCGSNVAPEDALRWGL